MYEDNHKNHKELVRADKEEELDWRWFAVIMVICIVGLSFLKDMNQPPPPPTLQGTLTTHGPTVAQEK